jgi:hypothetical protein
MKLRVGCAVGGLLSLILSLAQLTVAQTPTQTASALPHLVRFGGTVKDLNGNPLTGVVGITFALYSEQTGGTPLWLETQNVTADGTGHYTVLLGSTKSDGLPEDLFTDEQAHWVGVQVTGQAEQPRVLLASTPYALKAGDAETIGGLPPSAFMLATPGTNNTPNNPAKPGGSTDIGTTAVVSGSGTADFVPLWTNNSVLGNSVLFQSGSGSTATVGVNTITPAAALDVNGSLISRGTLQLPSTGTANASSGFNSQPFTLQGSAYNSSTQKAIGPIFQWQTEPNGNDTSTPAGTLNLLYGGGSGAPTETGLNIASTGKITFATGQTFPGAGTITGVTTAAGSGLTGGGTSGTLNLALTNTCAANQILQWNGSAWACTTIDGGGTITGVTAGTDLTGGGTSGTVTLNLDTTKVPQLASANTFTANQNVNGTMTATMFSGSGSGLSNVNASQLGGLASSAFAQLAAGSNTFNGGITASSFTGSGSGLTNVTAANALDLGGLPPSSYQPAGSYATTASNTFAGNQAIAGFNLYTYIGNPGCGSHAFAGIAFSTTGFQNCLNYSMVGDSANTYIAAPTGDIYFRTQNNAVTAMTIAPSGTLTLNGNVLATASTNVDGGVITGFSAPAGSSLFGSNGVDGMGGNGDFDNYTLGGNGVQGFGGSGGDVTSGTGTGGYFVGGDGVDATAGSSVYYAGNFTGDVNVSGAITAGTKDFKIDHPLDPANKYLVHASVESSEMKNIYDGNVTTDSAGQATVQLPEWFEVLNTDFRYQLTVIGQFAQAIIAREIENNRFEIRTNAPNVKVSWQVTGVRQDAYAKANPLVVEQAKEARLRGFYIHPELYGAPPEKQIEWARHPQMMKKIQEVRARQLAASQKQTVPRN